MGWAKVISLDKVRARATSGQYNGGFVVRRVYGTVSPPGGRAARYDKSVKKPPWAREQYAHPFLPMEDKRGPPCDTRHTADHTDAPPRWGTPLAFL
jgi:hypothetical protein